MESTDKDRRARGVRRVDFTSLVEICGQSGDTPAFEAEAVELSGRGMHVRTRFLPEQGAPLVLRFEHEGKEAVVEGEVAWRREHDKGGEFGIRFTALDSASVQVLRQACAETTSKAGPDAAAPVPERSDGGQPGSAVRLHIHGLGAPMKARVFESRGSRVHVGSQLEFLKVGRALELEDVDGGQKRAAEIHSVSVAIDPRTQIPQLVVALRYEGEDEDATPEPSVVGDDDQSVRVDARHRPKADRDARRSAARQADAEPSQDAELEPEDTEFEESEELFKGRFASWASGAGDTVQRGGASVAEFGRRASESLASVLGSWTRQRPGRAREPLPRKTTRGRSSVAVSPRGVERNGQKDRLRSQRGQDKRAAVDARPSPKRRLLVALGAVLVAASGAYPLFFAKDHPTASSAGNAALPAGAPAPLAPSALPAAAPFPAASALDTGEQLAASEPPVAVEVPLFGTQQLATLEAAPLTPPVEAAIDEVGMAQDQTFAKPVVPTLAKPAPKAESEPASEQAATPAGDAVWQSGRMHLPIVHRLRLDAPGSDVKGTKTPSGFSVLVPGRKVMETGAQIAKRDDRILSVNVKNTDEGGQVVFRFRKDVPGYKVRLRNDYVEFFINSKQD